MDCQRCHSTNPDGKNYCSDCGAPLDPSRIHLEEVIRTQVEETLDRKFKDQRLIAVEASEAIVNRIYGWAKLFAFFVGIPLALIFILLSVAGIEKYSDFKNLINSIEGQVKPRIEQAKTSADLAQGEADEAQKKANEAKATIGNITDQVNKELNAAKNLSQGVQDLSDRVSKLEVVTSQKMDASSQRVDTRMTELDRKIDAATKDIAEQQQKLASTNELVKSIFSKGTTEYFDTKANSTNIQLIPLGKNTFVVMLLKAAPIMQTLEIKWRVASQPRDSYGLLVNNVIFFNWGDPAENLKLFPLEVTYVPDPTVTAEPISAFSQKNGHVFAGTYQLPEFPQQPQPK